MTHLRRIANSWFCAAVLLAGGLASTTSLPAAEKMFAPPPPDAVRQRVLQWTTANTSEGDPQRASVAALWRWDAATAPTPERLLRLAVESWTRVSPELRQFIVDCEALDPTTFAALAALVDRYAGEPFVAANLRLFLGRALTERRMFDEALQVLASVDPQQAIDPAALFFCRGASAFSLLEIPVAQENLELLLERTEHAPVRYTTAAALMQAELKTLEEKSLGEVSRLMADSERRLDLGRAGEKVQSVQERIVATLDELIKKIEAQQGGGGGGGSSGNSNESSGPASDSTVKGATAPGETDKKKFSKEGQWGDLPDKQQADAKNLINRNFPPHYRQAIETYFKKLAGRAATPEK